MPRYSLCALPVAALLVCLPAAAQATKPAPISCTVRRTPVSPGDIAAAHGKWPDAITAYTQESQANGEEGERTHNALIRSELQSGKVSEAETEAAAWLSKSPADPWALDAIADVSFRNGNLDKAGDAFRAAATHNFCNAQVHADYAHYLSVVGYKASAKSQLEIAHKLDPIDDSIAGEWIHYQPRSSRAAALGDYLKRTSFLTDRERKSIEQEQQDLAGSPKFPCHLVTPLTTTRSMPFNAIHNGPRTNGQQSNVEWGLDVALDGKTRRLEIDSGAHGILLTKAAAASLGLEVQGHARIFGIANDDGMESTIAKVKSIKIGGLEFQDCAVEIMQRDVMISEWDADRSAMEGQDGIIGSDVFQNFLVTLDFPGHSMKLDPLPPLPDAPATQGDTAIQTGVEAGDGPWHDRYIAPSMAAWTKFSRVGHDIIIPVRLNSGPTHLFIVDTGAGVQLISPSAAKEVSHLGTGSPSVLVGVTGEVKKTYTTGPLTLEFAGLKQGVTDMTSADMPSGDNVIEVSGFLGQYTLHQLTLQIDYRDQLIHFTYDPSRIAHCMTNVTLDDCYP